MVYVRKRDTMTLTFLVSGALWRNSMVMKDAETHTKWSHVLGIGIIGPLKGVQLQSLPAVQTTWRAWRNDHPGTWLLKKETQVTSSPYHSYFDNPKKIGLFRSHWLRGRLPGKELVYGVHVDGEAVAITSGVIRRRKIVPVQIGRSGVLVVAGGDGGIRAYRAGAPGTQIHLKPAPRKGWAVDDHGGLWKLDTGRAISGPHRGAVLKPVKVHVAYWFAWSCFFPNTRVVD